MSGQDKIYLPQRVAHLINLVAIVLLVFTGFYIYYPFAERIMGTARYLHYVAGFALIINLFWRIYYAFLGKHRDYFEFKPEIGKILPVVKYYCFMGKPVITEGKYNPLQKLTYLGIPFLIICQGCTGIALAYPDQTAGFIHALGGLANVRSIHYLFTWVFICVTLLHVYAVFTEKPQQVLAMFFGKETDSQTATVKQTGSHVRQQG
ncbi:MAG: Ni/Fe-hydrogenase, b-type cytochrome subunit [Clostridia bacterium]|nr:Ni/Fe-hydrogenase, b-type cytochrome subunit [Clostridia bacterium]